MPIELIVGIQLALYGVAWSLAAWLVREERTTLLHWMAYAWLHAASAIVAAPMLAAGGTPPTIALIASVLGFAAAARGVDVFTAGRARFDRWGLALVLPTLAGIVGADLLLPTSQDHRRWVGLPYSVGLALLLLSYAALCWRPLRREHRRATVSLVLAPMVFTGVLGLTSALVRWRADAATLANVQHAARLPNQIGALVASAVFNLAFMFLLVSRLLAKLRDAARTDHLTGVLNRRTVEANLEVAWQQHQRTGSGLAVAMVDVDHFKRINDTHGHAAGDRALAYAAAALRDRTRPYDSVGRWGGEEFLIVMPATQPDDAPRSCERLRAVLADGSLAGAGVAFTVSVGVAVCREDDSSAAALVERADRAMYEAKRTGRNRVCAAR